MKGLSLVLPLVEKGLVPDLISRLGIRRLLEQRLQEEDQGSQEANRRHLEGFIEQLRSSPVAIHTDRANEQHYELPPEFFLKVLGRHLKYSGCLWAQGVGSLEEAEARMLELTCERAELIDGQRILELGCGWGSLSLWMAEHFPGSQITAMSNSAPQREFILARARERGIENLEVITCDINRFETGLKFDRVVSVEMFEHVRNHEHLLKRIGTWLKPGGKLFVHIFSHAQFAYAFETEGADNWMGRYFFTGGLMPSDDLLTRYQKDLRLEQHWRVNGEHYSKTARAWLDNLDRNRPAIDPILAEVYGPQDVTRWRVRWRLFFMACEELFGFRNGEEWIVSHYRFVKDAA